MSSEDRALERQLLIEIHSQMPEIANRLGAIEADLAHHIKRTELLEGEVKYLHKQVNLAHGAIALISFVVMIWKLFA